MENKDKIEIPFGAKDSELCECEYTIPEGYEAEIKDGKVILRKKESEDEKMIQYFKDLAPFDKAEELYVKYGFSHKDAIAWLEQQGEQKVIIPKFRVGDVIRYDEDGEINRVIEIVEEGYKLEHGTHILCFQSQDYWELVEQKPLSKEDEKLTNRIEGWLSTLCEYLKDENDFKCVADVKDVIEKLKSLRPQSSWKPSDEQMEAMQKALVDLCGKDEHNIITGLYYDLKKLKD